MKPHVLILEDDFLLAANLEEVVQEDLKATSIGVSTVAEALKIIPDDIALAFIDIEVRDGKSYPVARKLLQHDIPCIIVSGNEQSSLSEDLKDVPFLPKPVAPGRLVRLAKALSSSFH
jgi:DNA-binding LytR/AlgR family response regulator